MYESTVFLDLIAQAGLAVTQVTDGVGRFHTLLECEIAPASSAQADDARAKIEGASR
jgi:hypothetical protein